MTSAAAADFCYRWLLTWGWAGRHRRPGHVRGATWSLIIIHTRTLFIQQLVQHRGRGHQDLRTSPGFLQLSTLLSPFLFLLLFCKFTTTHLNEPQSRTSNLLQFYLLFRDFRSLLNSFEISLDSCFKIYSFPILFLLFAQIRVWSALISYDLQK